MAKEIFNRVEEKYIIDKKQYEHILGELEKYAYADEYSRNGSFYPISNIYYDTEDNNLIRTSLTKPVYKEKIRLRSYGTPNMDSKVFLELKKKYHGIVNKRRTALMLSEAYSFANTGEMPDIKDYMNIQVIKELEYSIKHYAIMPKVFLSYERQAYTGSQDKDLRITFDKNIISRREDIRLEYGVFGERVIPKDTMIMEIKYMDRMPLWLIALLRHHDLEKTSFSKYGTEYEHYLKYGIKERKLYA